MRYLLLDKIVSSVILPLALLISILVFIVAFIRLGQIEKESQTYNRYISCVLSIPAHERDTIRIDRCWTTVQEDTGKKVKRYDKE